MMMSIAEEGYNWSVKHSAELDAYAGRWVALTKAGVLAAASSLRELMSKNEVQNAKPFVTRIATREEILSIF